MIFIEPLEHSLHLLEHGTDLRYIQQLLGHENSRTTERYTRVTKKGFEKLVSALAGSWVVLTCKLIIKIYKPRCGLYRYVMWHFFDNHDSRGQIKRVRPF
jgi:hypothetical protein